MTRKTPTAFRYRPDLLERVRRMAKEQHRTVTTTLELLLEDALARAGYPAPTDADTPDR